MNIKDIYLQNQNDKGKIGRIFSSDEFKNFFHFNGELGALYKADETVFRVWTPVATEVMVEIYEKDDRNNFKLVQREKMTDLNGIFEATVAGNLDRKYYKYKLTINNESVESIDPYAKACSVNGEYGMVIDLEKTNPKEWETDKRPELLSIIDSILYEMHIRDFSIDENSGIENKGKFLGVVEEKTTLKGTSIKTGLDHLKELGITHVHLLPVFDYKTVDESKLDKMQYNWGYDPENYNCLEGSYSTNPFEGEIRIKEFKKMIQKLHSEGIRVVMDMVYNHVYEVKEMSLNKLVPMYYFRENEDGSFSNGSGCGNETASERSMFRKFMVDSILYFAKEYHIDGFRFDLMGLHDVDTMIEIRDELDKIDKSIIIYGEGWTGGMSPLPDENKAIKNNVYKYGNKQIAVFSDDMRDAVKGDVFVADRPGFVNGESGLCEKIKSGVAASTRHRDVYYSYFANEPYQTINYDSAHDNYTLWDKLQLSAHGASKEELIKMNKLVAAIILTSQGIPFLHAGEEFLRTKIKENGGFDENSYKSSDFVNKIDWKRKAEYREVFEYYKKLISLRKEHKAFRIGTRVEIEEEINFKHSMNNVVHYEIDCKSLKDIYEKVIVIYNGNEYNININLDSGDWNLILDGNEVNEFGFKKVTNEILVEGRTATILAR